MITAMTPTNGPNNTPPTMVSTDAGKRTIGRARYTPTKAKMPHQAFPTLSMNCWAVPAALRSLVD